MIVQESFTFYEEGYVIISSVSSKLVSPLVYFDNPGHDIWQTSFKNLASTAVAKLRSARRLSSSSWLPGQGVVLYKGSGKKLQFGLIYDLYIQLSASNTLHQLSME